MSFKVENPKRVVQMATDGSSTYYVGQIVAYSNIGGSDAYNSCPGTVVPLGLADDVFDAHSLQVIAGVVVGINNRTPVYSATYSANYVTGLTTQATQLARDVILNKGMYAAGDPQVLVDVAMIDVTSLIEGPIYNAAYGTAPTLLTSTTAETTGWTSVGATNACEFTPVANVCTAYCRTGLNAGLYRVTSDTSTTAPTVTTAFPYDVAIGDTFVRVPLKQGVSNIYIGGSDVPALYINSSLGAATDYFGVIVEELDLTEAGKEKALFRFLPPHFNTKRA